MINPDTLRERLRERRQESGWFICPNCEGGLSGDDIRAEHCSQCGTELGEVYVSDYD